MPRWMIFGFLTLAAAGTLGIFDADGHRVGTVREGPGGRLDIFGLTGERQGWGRRNADGSIELFDRDSNRLGTVTRDGAFRLYQQRKGGGKP